MCTASQNPKPYTGAKLVKRGAIALSGDAGIRTSSARSMRGSATRPAAAGRGSRRLRGVQRRRCGFIDPPWCNPLRAWSSTAGTAVAATMGATLAQLGLATPVETSWTPDGGFPDHEPDPLLPENRELIMGGACIGERSRARHGVGRRRRPLLLHRRRRGNFVNGDFLTALLADSMVAQASRGPRFSTTCGRAAAYRTRCRGRRHRAHQPGRPRLLQDPDAQGARRLRWRGLGALLLPRLLLRRLGHDPRAAHPRAPRRSRARAFPSCSSPIARITSSPVRSTPRCGPAGQDREDRRALRRCPPVSPGRNLDRLRGLALQRARLEYGAAAAPVPGVPGLARGHGAPARRGPRADPGLLNGCPPSTVS